MSFGAIAHQLCYVDWPMHLEVADKEDLIHILFPVCR